MKKIISLTFLLSTLGLNYLKSMPKNSDFSSNMTLQEALKGLKELQEEGKKLMESFITENKPSNPEKSYTKSRFEQRTDFF